MTHSLRVQSTMAAGTGGRRPHLAPPPPPVRQQREMRAGVLFISSGTQSVRWLCLVTSSLVSSLAWAYPSLSQARAGSCRCSGPHSQCRNQSMCHHALLFVWGLWIEGRPSPCTASTVLTEPPPQPCTLIFKAITTRVSMFLSRDVLLHVGRGRKLVYVTQSWVLSNMTSTELRYILGSCREAWVDGRPMAG